MAKTKAEQCKDCYFYGTSTSDYTCDRYLLFGIGHRLGKQIPGECTKFLYKRCTAEEIEENKKLDGTDK